MEAYWLFIVMALVWTSASIPVASAEQVCYHTFNGLVCKDRLPLSARVAIWAICVAVLFLIIITAIYVHRRRASRERDAIATVEASQVDGPPPTPFGSSFVQVQGPPVAYPFAPYGPRTAGAVPHSAYTVNFTPRTPGVPPARTPYSSSRYPTTPEVSQLSPYPASRGYRTPGPGLPESPRPDPAAPTPRDKNTRFVIPEPLPTHKKERRDWSGRLEALKSAPIKRDSFEGVSSEPPTQVKSAMVTGSFPKLKPLFTGTSRSKDFV
ncbi:hypothetical protein AX17_005050 [Amanita inopinata Kibby_2008]|nr:hypothetical protein AX17_005050 [Amanita inopinata Kibby_2008]